MAAQEYKVIDFCCTWKIEKFFTLFENCNILESLSVPISAFHSIYFSLVVEQPNKIILTVHKKKDLKLKLSDSDIFLNETNGTELTFDRAIQADEWIFASSKEFSSPFIKEKRNSHLYIKCHMFFGEAIHQCENNNYDTLDLIKLSRDIRKLNNCQKFCDIKLQVGNHTLNAHKAILFARSPNLLKTANLITDSSNISHVTNFSAPAFDLIFKYAYCAKLDSSNFQVPSGILKATDNLNLDNLKRKFCFYPNQINLCTRQLCMQTAFSCSVENISSMKLQSSKQMKFTPVFCSSSENYFQSEMMLEVTKVSEGEEGGIYYNVSLRCCFEQPSNIYFLKTNTSVSDIFGEQQNHQECQFQVNKSELGTEVSRLVYRIGKDEVDEDEEVLLPNDTLTFVLNVTFYNAHFDIDGISVASDATPDLSFDVEDRRQLSVDMEQLYNSKKYSDIIVTAGDNDFQVHKFVLFSRAPKMLSADEDMMGHIEITNIDPNVLEILLKYLYTAKLPEMTSGLAIKLYLAAYTYEINLLKQRCLNFVKNNLVF